MSKTMVWILVGILAAGGLGALAVTQLQSKSPETARGATPAAAVAAPAAQPMTVPPPAATAASVTLAAAASAAPAAIRTPPTIDDLIQNASAYEGAAVSLSGTIVTQCTAGCEVAIDDGTGVLSVQLEGKGKDRLIPVGKVGKRIEVHGVFHASPRPQIVIEDPNGWQLVK